MKFEKIDELIEIAIKNVENVYLTSSIERKESSTTALLNLLKIKKLMKNLEE